MAVLRSVPRLVLRPAFPFRLYVHCSLFIHAVANRRRRRFLSIQSSPFASCSVSSNLRSVIPLLVAILVSFLRPVLRLAARLVLMSSCPSSRLILFLSCRMPHACRPSCRRAVLFSSSCRSLYALSSSSSNDRMPQGGNRCRRTLTEASKSGQRGNETHAPRPLGMIRQHDAHTRNASSPYPQGKTNDETNETKHGGEQARRPSKTARRDDGPAGIEQNGTPRETQQEERGRQARRDGKTRCETRRPDETNKNNYRQATRDDRIERTRRPSETRDETMIDEGMSDP